MLSAIPHSRRTSVAGALIAAFGTAELDAQPVPLTGGLSGAMLFRIRVGGIAYVLRVEREVPLMGEGTRARTYACMRTAAAAMLAPRVWHANAEEGVSIVDLVLQVPLQDYPGEGEAFLVELAQAVRVLHGVTPPFPAGVEFLPGVESLITTHLANPLVAPAATADVFARYRSLVARYRSRPEDLVFSHNDLNPGNVLYDGRRLWLVDWEVAFRADRWLDLAAIANWFCDDASREDLLLRTYLKAEPSADQRARLRLMRIVNHVYYALVFLIGAAIERPDAAMSESLSGPNLAELRIGLKTGAFQLGLWESRLAYGKARLAEAIKGLRDEACARDLDRLAA